MLTRVVAAIATMVLGTLGALLLGGMVAWLMGCGATLSQTYHECLADALLRAQTRIDASCRGYTYDECPAAPSIRDQLEWEQERCR